MKYKLEKLTLLNAGKKEVIFGNKDKITTSSGSSITVNITTDKENLIAKTNVVYTLVFSSAITSFDSELILLSNATIVSSVYINNTTYNIEVEPAENSSGIITLEIPADIFADNNGNKNEYTVHNTQAFNTISEGFVFRDMYDITVDPANYNHSVTHNNTNEVALFSATDLTRSSYDSSTVVFKLKLNTSFNIKDYIFMLTKVFSEKYELGVLQKYNLADNSISFFCRKFAVSSGITPNNYVFKLLVFKRKSNHLDFETFNDPSILWRYNIKNGVLISNKNVVSLLNSTQTKLTHNLNALTDYNNFMFYSCKNGSTSYYNGTDNDNNNDFIFKQLNLYNYKEMLIDKSINAVTANNKRFLIKDFLIYQKDQILEKSDSINYVNYDSVNAKIVIYTNKDLSNENLYFMLNHNVDLTNFTSAYLIYGGDRIVYYSDRIEIFTIYNVNSIGVTMLNLNTNY